MVRTLRGGHRVYLTVYWRDGRSNAKGRETLALLLDNVWSDLITTAELKHHRALQRFYPDGPDHLARRAWAKSQSQARRAICAAARTLQFMDATKLRPSKGYTRALQLGSSNNTVPGSNHSSIWYAPLTNRYLLADEPHEATAKGKAAERAEWARRHRFVILKPSWPGMFKPDGGSRLYLIVDAQRGVLLSRVVPGLERLPEPIVATRWSGESAPASPPFHTPGTLSRPKASA